MASGRGLSMLSVAPAWALLSKLTSARYTAGWPGAWASGWLVRTLPCSKVPTGTLLVSSWVRVDTWLALACCNMIARRLLSVWLTVIWLPWGSGWLALACSWVCTPLACISRSTS